MSGLKTLLKDFLRRVWAENDTSAIFELMAKDALIDGMEESGHGGAADFAAFHRMIAAQFKDMSVILDLVVEDGDWIAATAMISGAYRANGAPLAVRTQMIVRFERGLIAEGRNIIDFLTMFEQVGLLPERTLDFCLVGMKPRF